jgi:YfiH family protein
MSTVESVEFLQSPVLLGAGFRHGFFTRRGGASTGPYATLNFSAAVGDSPASVETNLTRAAAALGVARERLYYLTQVHGAAVIEVTGDEVASTVAVREGDALVARGADVACGVRVADCVPVLLGDAATGAVAAVHAGWRGVVADVVGAAVAALRRETEGAAGLVAAIGPHISEAAFEVGEEVAQQLDAVAPEAAAVQRVAGQKPRVALRALVRAQLLRAGLRASDIDDVAGCTFTEPERFFSFRRDGPRSGRHLAAIATRSAARR